MILITPSYLLGHRRAQTPSGSWNCVSSTRLAEMVARIAKQEIIIFLRIYTIVKCRFCLSLLVCI